MTRVPWWAWLTGGVAAVAGVAVAGWAYVRAEQAAADALAAGTADQATSDAARAQADAVAAQAEADAEAARAQADADIAASKYASRSTQADDTSDSKKTAWQTIGGIVKTVGGVIVTLFSGGAA